MVTQNSKTSIEEVKAREQSQVHRLQPRANSRPKPIKSAAAGAKRGSVSAILGGAKGSKLWIKSHVDSESQLNNDLKDLPPSTQFLKDS